MAEPLCEGLPRHHADGPQAGGVEGMGGEEGVWEAMQGGDAGSGSRR